MVMMEARSAETAAADALEEQERHWLERCEAVIERGLQTFYQVGNALLTIRDNRLYREEHQTFEEYCRTRWQMTKTHANRMIQAAGVVENLTPTGVIPGSERQARELAVLPPDLQTEAWKEIIKASPDGTIQTKQVHEIVKTFKSSGAPSGSAADLVEGFLGPAPPDPADTEQEEQETRPEPPTLPTGRLIIPADAAPMTRLTEALAEGFVFLDTGTIPAPVVVSGRAWLPLSREDEGTTRTIEAVRVMALDLYLAGNYEVKTPLVTAEAWEAAWGRGERELGDYGGLVVRVKAADGEKVVLLRQRAVFRGPAPTVAEQQATAPMTVSEAAEADTPPEKEPRAPVVRTWQSGDSDAPAALVAPTAKAFPVTLKLSQEQARKLGILCDRNKVTPADMVGVMIDAWFESLEHGRDGAESEGAGGR